MDEAGAKALSVEIRELPSEHVACGTYQPALASRLGRSRSKDGNVEGDAEALVLVGVRRHG